MERTSKDLYSNAYDLQYNKKDYVKAYVIYQTIIEKYPESKEAQYAISQLANIENIPDFSKDNITVAIKDKALEYNSEQTITNIVSDDKFDKNFLTSSGFNFEGYKIIEYFDFISSEKVMGMGIFKGISSSLSNIIGAESTSLSSILEQTKSTVLRDLKKQALMLGANALIGIDLDYTMFGDSLVGVIMSGTAIKIEETNTKDSASK
ncbi:YbjQ family protein [Anaerotignum sp.]|uniref:YbjQ family protein n=1 Tax=Anaerotignum sp. TaxID=2039241 RepID=UPI00289DDACE|nr:YbjQ family protein [Anaerotignum sp.]